MLLSDNDKAFNKGFNSYRIDEAEPMSPYTTEALTIEFDAGWLKAKNYFAKHDDALHSSNFS